MEGPRLHKALLECAHGLWLQAQVAALHALEVEATRLRQQEIMGLLAQGMAHDFNNLLQLTLNCIAVAKRSAVPGSELQQVLERSDSTGARARELSHRLQLLTKGSIRPDRLGSLEPLLKATLAMVMAGSTVKWECHMTEDLPAVSYEAACLEEVVVQLARNAMEAMPAGGTLEVWGRLRTLPDLAAQQLPAGPYLEYSFFDSGRGIAPEHLSRIFQPYFTTKTASGHKGTGLGLALCEALLRAHGGMISAESQPGAGATFRILLPAVAGAPR